MVLFRRLPLLALLMILTSFVSLVAAPPPSPNAPGMAPISLPLYGCKFEVPDVWLINKLDANSPAAFIADNPVGGKFVLTVKDIKDKVDVTGDDFGSIVKDQLKQQGYEITRGTASQFRGLGAYVVDCKADFRGQTMYVKSVSFQNGTLLYTLTLGKLNAKPDTDAQYLGILESFALAN